MEEHEVALVNWNFDIELFGNLSSARLSFQLLLNISDGVLDGICAFRARIFSPHKDVKIEV